ncbi:uncharacterized protein [Hyperolius riggenbachi]|uniref:uncharacterized protein n=1 Tax=Hyperolius riggenbachi TaxID=752182 RepID=UPI0035A2F03F
MRIILKQLTIIDYKDLYYKDSDALDFFIRFLEDRGCSIKGKPLRRTCSNPEVIVQEPEKSTTPAKNNRDIVPAPAELSKPLDLFIRFLEEQGYSVKEKPTSPMCNSSSIPEVIAQEPEKSTTLAMENIDIVPGTVEHMDQQHQEEQCEDASMLEMESQPLQDKNNSSCIGSSSSDQEKMHEETDDGDSDDDDGDKCAPAPRVQKSGKPPNLNSKNSVLRHKMNTAGMYRKYSADTPVLAAF